jgi:hypothetical protein
MISPDRKTVKRWRRGVRRELKKSPARWREFRRHRSRFLPLDAVLKWRVLVPIVIAGLLLIGVPEPVVANQLLLWTMLATFSRALQIANHTRNPHLLWLWYSWPVANDDVYTHQRSVVLRSSLWLGIDWLVFGLALALAKGALAPALAAPVLAAAQGATALAIAAGLVRWKPQFPFGWVIMPLYLLMFLAIQFGQDHGEVGLFLGRVFHWLHEGTPAGWLTRAFAQLTHGHASGWLYLLGLGAGATAILLAVEKTLRKRFDPDTLFGYEPPSEAGDSAEAADAAPASSAPSTWSPENLEHRETTPVDLPKLREAMHAAFDAPVGSALSGRGRVEESVVWFLNARQRVLVDFMMPAGTTWLRRWCIAAALTAAIPLLRTLGPDLALFPAIGALAFALPLTGGRWLGFEAMRTFQSQVGLSSYVPAGFGEITRLVIKLNTIYCVLAFPLVVAVVRLGFTPANAGPWWAMDFAARGLAIVIALQPIWVLGKYSPNTNDSTGGVLFLLGVVAVLFVELIAGVTLCVIAMMAARLGVALVCLAGVAALAHSVLALYGWAWGRGSFDLIAKPK